MAHNLIVNYGLDKKMEVLVNYPSEIKSASIEAGPSKHIRKKLETSLADTYSCDKIISASKAGKSIRDDRLSY